MMIAALHIHTILKKVHFGYIAVLVIACLLIQTVTQSRTASAAPVVGFDAGNIIDDAVFTNSASMSVGQIQAFFNAKVPVCDTNGTQASEFGGGTRAQWGAANYGQSTFICLKDFSEGGKSSAQIIYDASQEFQINPQVLIVLLQKEQGLVTDTWPLNIQYRSATGYGCPDTAPCDSQYYGLTNQVRWSARMFRAILNNSPTWYTPYVLGSNFIQYNPQSSCGGTSVNIQNRSTQALYNYTPYQPNPSALNAGYGTGDSCGAYGNRNFYLYFSDWFGSTRISKLVRTPSSPTYYLLTNGKKFAISSGDILYAYGLQTTPLSVVTDTYLNTVEDGGTLGTIFTEPGNATVYLADGGKKYGIPSGAMCTSWGLLCGDMNAQKEVGQDVSLLLINGGTLQPIMKFANSYYYMQAGKKQLFNSQKALEDRGFSSSNATSIINWSNAIRPYGVLLPENNLFIKFSSNDAIYFYSGNQFYVVPSLDIFFAWSNPNTTPYLDTVSSYVTAHPATAGALSALTQSNGVISLLNGQKKLALIDANPSELPLDVTSNTALSNFIATKQSITVDSSKALALSNGTIVALKSGVLRPIPTMTDLRMSYTDANVISVPSTITKAYPVGKLYMIPGRIFRPSDSGGAMYIYGADGNLWALGSLDELKSTQKWNADIVNTAFSNIDFSSVKIYSSLTKINNTPYAVMPDGKLKNIPLGAIADTTKLLPLDGAMTASLQIDSTAIRFIRFDNGTIFQVNSATINAMSSINTYNSLGGNSTNTASMPLRALDAFNTGNSI